jgi:hypothetical protein
MHWLLAHRLLIGVLADFITLAGGVILSRDALLRLRELRNQRTDKNFRARFARLNLTDEELQAAVVSVRWAFTGCLLLAIGFFLQLIVKFIELGSGNVS